MFARDKGTINCREEIPLLLLKHLLLYIRICKMYRYLKVVIYQPYIMLYIHVDYHYLFLYAWITIKSAAFSKYLEHLELVKYNLNSTCRKIRVNYTPCLHCWVRAIAFSPLKKSYYNLSLCFDVLTSIIPFYYIS
jgi:hypothetical protein